MVKKAAQVLALEREEQALVLVRSGMNFTRGAHELGMSRNGFQNAYIRAMKRIEDDIRLRAHLHLAEQLDMLERMRLAVWSKAIDSTHPQQLEAIRVAETLLDKRAKLLDLYAPDKHLILGHVEVQTIDAHVDAMEQRVVELRALPAAVDASDI